MFDWLNANQGAVMVILTLVYVITTVLLLASNRGLRKQANNIQQQNVRIQLFDKRVAVYNSLRFIIGIISEYDGTVDSIDKMITSVIAKDQSTRQTCYKAIDKLTRTIDKCEDEETENQCQIIQMAKSELLETKLTLIEIFKNEFEITTSFMHLFDFYMLEKMTTVNYVIGKLAELMIEKYASERDNKEFAIDLIEYSEVSKAIKEAKETLFPYIIEKLSLDDVKI